MQILLRLTIAILWAFKARASQLQVQVRALRLERPLNHDRLLKARGQEPRLRGNNELRHRQVNLKYLASHPRNQTSETNSLFIQLQTYYKKQS